LLIGLVLIWFLFLKILESNKSQADNFIDDISL